MSSAVIISPQVPRLDCSSSGRLEHRGAEQPLLRRVDVRQTRPRRRSASSSSWPLGRACPTSASRYERGRARASSRAPAPSVGRRRQSGRPPASPRAARRGRGHSRGRRRPAGRSRRRGRVRSAPGAATASPRRSTSARCSRRTLPWPESRPSTPGALPASCMQSGMAVAGGAVLDAPISPANKESWSLICSPKKASSSPRRKSQAASCVRAPVRPELCVTERTRPLLPPLSQLQCPQINRSAHPEGDSMSVQVRPCISGGCRGVSVQLRSDSPCSWR